MKSHIIAFILSFLFFHPSANGQYKTACNCPENTTAGSKADTVLDLSNGKSIALCGSVDRNGKSIIYSGFILSVCGQDSIIDAWDDPYPYRIKKKKDTLYIEQIETLPTGKNFEYQDIVSVTERLYLNKDKVVRGIFVNKHMASYKPEQIKKVLAAYEAAPHVLNDSNMNIARELFIATISGSAQARKYFTEFATKFGTLDGAFAEDYEDLDALLSLWDERILHKK